jgi:hypothetical protein
MLILMRMAGLVTFSLSILVSSSAAACSIPPPPPPPPRATGESEAAFEARSGNWYRRIAEQEWQEALPKMAAKEDQLWMASEHVVLARVKSIGSTRLWGSEGQRYKSPLVTLHPVQWLKGRDTVRRIQVHYLSDDSCASGGAGDAPHSEVGDLILLFYKQGIIKPSNVLDTFRLDRVVTQRSQRAFDLGTAKGPDDR